MGNVARKERNLRFRFPVILTTPLDKLRVPLFIAPRSQIDT